MTHQRRNLILLAFSLIVVMLAFGMVMPIFPFLLTRLGGSGGEYGLLIALYSIMQLIFAPLWGSLSDRIGRKPVLAVGMLGNSLTLLIFGLADRLWVLYLARTLSGLISCATLPAAMAYIADSTPESERGAGIGQLGGAVGLGVILGPGLGGWLAGDSLSMPFFIAAGMSLVSLLLIIFLLPESLPAEHRRTGGQLTIFHPRHTLDALRGPLGLLLFMAFLVSFGAINFQAIFGLYALEKFDFTPEQVGTVLVVVGLVSALVQGVLTGPATRRWGEVAVIRWTLLTNAAGFLILLLARTYPGVLLTAGIYTLSHALLRPSVQALTSRRAPMAQGAAMGLNNAFLSLGQIAGPLWAGLVFDLNVDLPYLSGALIMLAGFLIWSHKA
ncbi:MAG: MFS transporter [Anaerolineales bacterium]|nr:MFS transporter [Anaerolineales bacterium]